MFIAFALAFALAGADASKDTCAKLASDFAQNEWEFAFSHDLDARVIEINQEAERSKAALDHSVAMAAAKARSVGGYAPSGGTYSTGSDDIEKAREKLAHQDREYKEEGDRITQLLIANKCTPPDHVTSWFTYSKKNPNRRELKKVSDRD
jgi:hypothetical protein